MTTKVNTNMGVKQNINMRAGASSGIVAQPMARATNN